MAAPTETGHDRTLLRGVGVVGLTFFALGSVIGSGWLFGAMNGVNAAGPASIISWPLAGVMLLVIVLVFAELGPMYPVAGGMARFAHYSFGGFGGFTVGWISWIFSMSLAPIEVEGALTYISGLNHMHWMINPNGTLTMPKGYVVAGALMLLFIAINLYGVKLFSDTNSIVVWWKVAVPVITIVALLFYFKSGNYSLGGGFLPKQTNGIKGIFLALPAGVVFGEIGFDSAIQMAGEARNPRRDMTRAVLYSTAIGVIIYTLLQIAFIGALPHADIAHGWAGVSFPHSIHGPYAGIAAAVGLTWLTWLLYIDAFVSPSGTGLIYTGTHSRLLYGMARERYIPKAFGMLNSRSVPWVSIVFGWFIGMLLFLPFPSWSQMVGPITNVAVISYAVGPLAMAHLRKTDPDRDRPFRLRYAAVVNPIAFIFANLLVYWTGWQTIWRVDAAIIVGIILFAVSYLAKKPEHRPPLDLRYSVWLWPYFVGIGLISLFGSFKGGKANTFIDQWYHPVNGLLKFPYDTIVVAVFSIAIYYFAAATALPADQVQAYIANDDEEVTTIVPPEPVAA